MSNSRTTYVARNASVGLICQVINLILQFVSRTIFIKTLGADYLGVNGLFSNVLSILSFAELGIGNAMVFSMYKPLAEKDDEKLASLMQLYKKAYRWIFCIVVVLGVAVVPFLDYVIKGEPKVSENLTLLYLLFLSNTAISYLVVYKKSILTADQKNYIVLAITETTHILQICLQVYVLFAYHNFIAYLLIQIGFTFLGNLMCASYANRKYPVLKETPKELDKKEKKTIFDNIKAMAMYKFGSIVLNSTDNILISAFLGVTPVGIVSNYVMLYTACNSFLGCIAQSFVSSVGNLNVAADPDKKYKIFNSILLITVWMYGFAFVGLFTLSNELVDIWLGSEYVIDNFTLFAILLGFYVWGVHSVESNHRSAMGYFTLGKHAPLLSAILNLILSIVLFKLIGLPGIFLATPVSRFLGLGIIDTRLLYNYAFHKPSYLYYIKNFLYILLFGVIVVICKYVINIIEIEGILGFIVDACVVTIIFNITMMLVFKKTEEYKEIASGAKALVKKRLHKSK